ncbi:MAG TPA: hypothetical protein VHV82_11520 [Sporichthyaceae bacterium]|jgi:hypothetical protein|nr:hypothetical protein [Sporichthyaceae bacterium]
MNVAPDGREIIPAGKQPGPGYRHLIPIAKFLIEERGHLPLDQPQRFGFHNGDCQLTRSITADDWAAVNERFVLPDHVGFFCGYIIRDYLNEIDILGFDTFQGLDGDQPVEVMEEEIRKRDAHLKAYGEALRTDLDRSGPIWTDEIARRQR